MASAEGRFTAEGEDGEEGGGEVVGEAVGVAVSDVLEGFIQ